MSSKHQADFNEHSEVEGLVGRLADKEMLLKAKDIDTETWPFIAKLTFEEYQQFRTALTSHHQKSIEAVVQRIRCEWNTVSSHEFDKWINGPEVTSDTVKAIRKKYTPQTDVTKN